MNSLDETHCHCVAWKEFSEASSWTALLVLPFLVPFVSPLKERAQHTALAYLLGCWWLLLDVCVQERELLVNSC